MESALLEEINRLRSLNLSPKQIARSLKLRPAEVSEILRQQAAILDLERAARGEIAPLHKCMVNTTAAMSLLDPDSPLDADSISQGFAEVFIARKERQRLMVCSYLVDYWCLGVKDTFGPRKMDLHEYESMLTTLSSEFGESFTEITLEQAQAIVFGSVDYAAKLGMEPHSDFAESQPHLGARPDRLIPIEFGKNGKPFYTNGPYDNPDLIRSKLDKAVGKGNYDYRIVLDPSF
jgi:hypothetical protein